MHHRMSNINGMPVRILRIGVAGALAYEVHGKIQDAHPVHAVLMAADKEFGVRRLGQRVYLMNHTEDGFPGLSPLPLSMGRMGPDIEQRYWNPVEPGGEKMIRFDHDFVGRKALEKEVANPRRKMVTLFCETGRTSGWIRISIRAG
jgi:glycine cleavage system aminomethyltransferase T